MVTFGVLEYFIGAILVLGIGVAVLGIISCFSDNKWFCNKMGWHKAPKNTGFDGCSNTGVCPRCNKSVLQDGQGNWF